MAETTTAAATTPNQTDPATSSPTRPNGLTDEQVRVMLSALGRRKNDPGYLKRGEEGVAEYRRRVQEEVERDLADENK